MLQELGVSTNSNYKITFMLDSAAMITVHTPRRGLIDVRAPVAFVKDECIFFVFKLSEKKKKSRI